MDQTLFYLINHSPHPWKLDQLALFLDVAGRKTNLLPFILLFCLAGIIVRKNRLWQGALALAAAVFVSIALTDYLKLCFPRQRPFNALAGVTLVGHAWGGSFPSGHAARYATLCVFMMCFTKLNKGFWIAVMAVTGLCRVYQGVHYPSDVFAGWVIGGMIGWFAAVATDKFKPKEGSA